jgi:CAAX prenyl protease-like protein
LSYDGRTLSQRHPNRHATAAFIAPFLAFVGLMALERAVALPPLYFYPVRFVIVLGILLTISRPWLNFRPSSPLLSIAMGVAVFVIWIGPDQWFGYRHHWLFENSITGQASSTLPPELRSNVAFLALRCVASFALIPVLEELFWRGWMMRWLIDREFLKVPLGQYASGAFWTVALLFASEHGSFWEVGLAAGILYNWWLVRTRNLADCILAHAVTNALLCGWVITKDQWQYWL